MAESELFLVDSQVLPDVFAKVVHAKKLLATGKAKTLSEATTLAEISRSAFYKYKDFVFTYENQAQSKIATIYAELADETGVLSALLLALGRAGANILTINQNIPVDGVAPVSVAFRTRSMTADLSEMLAEIRAIAGVVKVRIIS